MLITLHFYHSAFSFSPPVFLRLTLHDVHKFTVCHTPVSHASGLQCALGCFAVEAHSHDFYTLASTRPLSQHISLVLTLTRFKMVLWFSHDSPAHPVLPVCPVPTCFVLSLRPVHSPCLLSSSPGQLTASHPAAC